MKPPARPEEVLRRVLKVSGFDGWNIVVLAGLGLLISLAGGDFNGAYAGVLILGAGVMELSGRRLLRQGDADGVRRMAKAQIFVLGVMVVYCVVRLVSFDAQFALGNLTPDMKALLGEAGLDPQEILPLVRATYFLIYGVVLVVTLVYQGGMALYYRRRLPAVEAALEARRHPVPPAPPPLPARADDDWSI